MIVAADGETNASGDMFLVGDSGTIRVSRKPRAIRVRSTASAGVGGGAGGAAPAPAPEYRELK